MREDGMVLTVVVVVLSSRGRWLTQGSVHMDDVSDCISRLLSNNPGITRLAVSTVSHPFGVSTRVSL